MESINHGEALPVIIPRSNKNGACYTNGRAARARGQGTESCPYGSDQLQLKHWFLAGWHDADMELKQYH